MKVRFPNKFTGNLNGKEGTRNVILELHFYCTGTILYPGITSQRVVPALENNISGLNCLSCAEGQANANYYQIFSRRLVLSKKIKTK